MIVLAPETLELTFHAVKQDSWPNVLETLRRSSEWLSSELGDHGRALLWLRACAHMPAVEGSGVDQHLDQFMPAEAAAAVEQVSAGARCHPSARVVLADDSGGWWVWRAVEKSLWIENGVYVDTEIHIQNPDPEAFGAQAELFAQLDELADRAVGLQREEEQ